MSSWLGHSRTHKPPTAPKWSPGSWYNNNLHVINISVFLFWTLWGTLSRLWAKMSEPSPDPHQLSTQTWKNSSRIWPLPDPLRKKKKKNQKSRVRGEKMSLGFPGGLTFKLKLAAESDFVSVPGTCRNRTGWSGHRWCPVNPAVGVHRWCKNVGQRPSEFRSQNIYCFSQASWSKRISVERRGVRGCSVTSSCWRISRKCWHLLLAGVRKKMLAGWLTGMLNPAETWEQPEQGGVKNQLVIGDPGWFGWVCVAENTLGECVFWIIRLARYSLAASVREQEPRDVFRPRRCWFIF